MEVAGVSILTAFFFLVGVPIFLVIAVWIIGISLILDFTLANFSVTLFEGLSSYALLSLPLFILAGDVMRESFVAAWRHGAHLYWSVRSFCSNIGIEFRHDRGRGRNHVS
jgi:hypothetical protein